MTGGFRSLSLRRRAAGFLALSAGCCVFVAAGISRAAEPTHSCVAPQEHIVASELNPEGVRWTVAASIHNVEGCRAWLLGIKFVPFGSPAGSWRGSWRIPAAGHLSDGFTISALSESSDSVGVISGVVGAKVDSIVLAMSDGERLTARPKLPAKELRSRFMWLRGMRYFVRYFPVGKRVASARLLGARGETVYLSRGSEGEFRGPR